MSAVLHGDPVTAPRPHVSSSRVAIFAATSWEMQAILDAGTGVERTRVAGYPAGLFSIGQVWYYVIQTGMGPQCAERAAKAVLAEARWGAVLSAGFAGGLTHDAIGSLVIGTEVLAIPATRDPRVASRAIACDHELVQTVVSRWSDGCRVGAFVSANTVVCQAQDKAAIAGLFDAVAIDMESEALGRVATSFGIPFLIVRTLSDRVDQSLPLDFNLFLRTDDRMGGWLKGVARCVLSPSSIAGLIRLGRQSRRAAEQLTRGYATLLPTLITTHRGMGLAQL